MKQAGSLFLRQMSVQCETHFLYKHKHILYIYTDPKGVINGHDDLKTQSIIRFFSLRGFEPQNEAER